MKKIGIMTWYKYRNYGTLFQVTALSEIIKGFGYEPYVIQYGVRKPPPGIIENVWLESATFLLKRLKDLSYSHYDNTMKDIAFDHFISDHLIFTDQVKTLSELQLLNDSLDAFVCGSDQIWSPHFYDPHFFLDFVTDNHKKIAYAPSIGVSKIDDEFISKRMKELIGSIDFLSVREKAGGDIIFELTGRKARTVLDPTLLLSDKQWSNFCDGIQNTGDEPYVLAYMLGQNKKHWKAVHRIADKLGLSLRIIPVYKKDLQRQGVINEVVGPAEFISLFNKASYVCTDSFHGLTFSLIFHKPFTVFERFKAYDKVNQNSRIYNLLDEFDLWKRLYRDDHSLGMTDEKIDFAGIDSTRKILADESLKYLSTSLADAVNSKHKNTAHGSIGSNMLCCGCGACSAVCTRGAIKIELNNDGFYAASINSEMCISCGKCTEVCPFMIERDDRPVSDCKLFSFKSGSRDVLMKSSSGGAAYHIARHYLGEGYRIAGCIFDRESQTARHIVIDPGENSGLERLQGSKYMQSNFSGIVKQLYQSDKQVVVFGTPCQIAGMKALLGDRDDVVLVELICYGVPSYHLYSKYRQYLHMRGFDADKLSVVFRDKNQSWHTKYIRIDDSHKTESVSHDKDPYLMSFECGLCYSHECYECPWRDKSAADLRLGDYWGKRFKKDETGVSEIVAVTEKGMQAIDRLVSEDNLAIEKHEISDYLAAQKMINTREPAFWNEYIADLADPNIPMQDIMCRYVLPIERRQRIMKPLAEVYHFLKDTKK